MPNHNEQILSVKGLDVTYGSVLALRGVSVEVSPGEIVGIVGESGSGKSTLLRAVAHLLPGTGCVTAGKVLFQNVDITKTSRREMTKLRGSALAYLFQNGEQSLDPLFSVGQQFGEVKRAHGHNPEQAEECALLRLMGFEDPKRILRALPSELSGGMAQRVALAFALAGKPSLLLADEPTSALDVDAQARVMELLRKLNREEALAVLLVSHDIDLVASVASRVYVMRNGIVVESGSTTHVLTNPQHPYTKELIGAVPRM